MKKFILSILIPLFFGAFASGQAGYDLEFKFKLEQDTVVMGSNYVLTGTIKNYGASAFKGNINFNVSVYNLTSPDVPPEPTFVSFQLPGNPYFIDIAGNGTATFNFGSFEINGDRGFLADTSNIVIVWPDDGYQDDNDNNNYGIKKLFVLKDTASSAIKPAGSILSNFSVFPNPAKNDVKISFEGVRNGTITLSDITGKILHMQSITAADNDYMNLSLDLDGKPLADGMYFITLQTNEHRAVRKLQIIK